jgi:pimeloyl-ACP methyl ester carboxylesterase
MSKTKSRGKTKEMLKLQGAKIEVERLGKGPPLVLLQSEDAYEADLPLIERLALRHEVFLPWAPGFGRSSLPDTVMSIDDIAYIYLDLMDHFELRDATLMGFSLGGWIAAEIATKSCARLRSVILVDPLGAKFGGPLDRDIADIYFLPFATVKALKFADPSNDPLDDMTTLSDKQAMLVARHRETTARLCWEPYFHNPALKNRLHRIRADTLVLWGAKDGLVRPKYGRAYAKRIPGAKFVSLPNAGHYPHIEQPEPFLSEVEAFLARDASGPK